ncbi:MAG: right-handed parallel beta-helix repeat-containing protein, partial [Candidatus Thermoplasmatota archaeon]|nr:right-handed parallel beta-helix repeat-containing protein [Candidatus Thermoplasmatota archaeon]
MGWAFSPTEDIVIRSVRHYFGTRISIWAESDPLTRIVDQAVVSTPGQWVETPLASPVVLNSGVSYRIGAYSAGGNYYWNFPGMPAGAASFPRLINKVDILQGYEIGSDAYPTSMDSVCWGVDFVYTWGSPDLKWWASSYDPAAIQNILGQNGTADQLTFVPQTGFSGTTTATLRLTDSDGRYTEQDIVLEWTNTPPSTPTNPLDLGDRVTNHVPVVSWDPAVDPDGDPLVYDVQVSRNGGAWVNQVVGTASTSAALSYYYWLDGDFGYWRVRSFDGTDYSDWTADSYFQFNNPPKGSPPSSWTGLGTRITDRAPTVSWDPGSDPDGDALTYYVYLEHGPTGQVTEAVTANTWTQLNLQNWGGGDWGRWWVVAYDGYEFSDKGYIFSSNTNTQRFYAESNDGMSFQRYIAMGGHFPNRYGAAIADFNNDGYHDMVYGAYDSAAVQVRLYYIEKTGPNAQFAAPVVAGLIPHVSSTITTEMAYGDVNNDGNMDVIASTRESNIHVFLGDGNGGFTLHSTVTVPSGFTARGKSLGDFNNSGNLDLLVATSGTGVYLFTGNGDGTFQAASSTPVVTMPGGTNYGVATGDFDNDGKVDAFVSYSTTGNIYFLKGHGDGTFTRSTGAHISMGAVGYTTIESYRLDRNGELGLLASEASGTRTRYFFGDGTGNFTSEITAIDVGIAQTALAAPKQSTSFFAINDAPRMPTGLTIDNGTMAVSWNHVSNSDYGTDDTITYYVYSMNATGKWALDEVTANNFATLDAWTWDLGEWGRWYVVADDGYERSDNGFILVGGESGQNWYVRNHGDGTFGDFSIAWNSGSGYNRGGGIADFDGDGLFDFVRGNSSDEWCYFFKQISPGVFADPVKIGNSDLLSVPGGLGLQGYEYGMTVADFNNDGTMDIFLSGLNNQTYSYWGNGDGTFNGPSLLANQPPPGTRTYDMSSADINNDGNYDLIVGTNQVPTDYYVYYGNGDGTFGNPVFLFSNSNMGGGYHCSAADFNGDGFVDIMAGSSSGGRTDLHLGDGGTTWTSMGQKMSTGSWTKGKAYDFDHDGWADLALATHTGQQLRIYWNDGGADPTFTLGDSKAFGVTVWGVAVPTLLTNHFTVPLATPPDAPTNVVLSLTGDWDDIRISWTNGTEPGDYLRVYYRSGTGAWNLVADNIYANYWTHLNAANDEFQDSYYIQAVNAGGTANSGVSTIYEWVVNGTATQSYDAVTISTPNNITVYGNMVFQDSTLYCNRIVVQGGASLRLDVIGPGTNAYVNGYLYVLGELRLAHSTIWLNGSYDGHRCIKTWVGSYLNTTDVSGIRSNNSFKYDFWIDGYASLDDVSIYDAGYDGAGSRGVMVNSSGNSFWNVILRNGGAYGFNLYGNNNTFSNVNITGTFIRGFNIKGQYTEIWDSYINASQYAIICEAAAHYLVVENSMLSGNNNEAALYVEVAGDNFLIANNTFFDDNTGLSLRGSGHIVRGNVFYVDSNAIYAFSCSNILIINNTVHGGVFNSGTGIDIASSTDSIISGNNVSDVGGAGARLTSCTNVTVIGNDFINCGIADYLGGVRIYQGSGNFVIGNNLSASYHGVFVLGRYDFEIWTENHEIRDNIMYNVDHVGIYLWRHTRYCTVSNNTVVGSTEAGIRIEAESTGHEIWGNSVSYSGTNGIFVASGTHHVQNNNVSHSESTGIYVASGAHQIRDNSLWLCNGGIDITSGASLGNIIDNNNIYSNCGIHVLNIRKGNTTISNNTITHIATGPSTAIDILGVPSNLIENNTINTQNTNARCIFLSNSHLNTIRFNNITTVGSLAYGMYLSYSNNAQIYGNEISSSGGDTSGIYLVASIGTTVEWCNITISHTTSSSSGIHLYTSTDVVLRHINIIAQLSATGLYIRRSCNRTVVIDCSITTEDGYAISLQSASDILLKDNIISGSTTGIYATITTGYPSYNVTIENNNITGSSGYGIHLYEATTNFVIRDNNISSSGNYAVMIEAGAHQIRNNTMWLCSGAVHIENTAAAGNIIDNNTIYSNAAFNVILINRGSTTFSNNTLTHISIGNTYAIWIASMSTSCIVENNTITTEKLNAHGIYTSSGANSNIIRYNTITTSGGNAHGIYLYSGSDSCNVYNNQVTTSGGSAHGIYIYQSSSVDITSNTVLTQGDNSIAIYMEASSFVIVNGGYANTTNIVNGGAWAIAINGGSDNTIDDVEVNIGQSSNSNYAIYIYGTSSRNQILNSRIYPGANRGIFLSFTSESIVRYNYIIGSSDCIRLSSSNSGFFENNTIEGTGRGFYISEGSEGNTFGNNTLNGLAEGMYFLGTRGVNNVLYNNNITNCTTWGVNIEEGPIVNWFSTALHRIENNNVRMEGNITILSGGDMRWSNGAELQFSPGANGQYHITVDTGGSLHLQNCAFASTTAFNYDFWVTGYISVEDSTIEHVGYAGGGSQGIIVSSSGNRFVRANILNGDVIGIWFIGDNNVMEGGTIQNMPTDGLRLQGNNNTISGVNISLCSTGILLWGDDNRILNNSISAQYYALNTAIMIYRSTIDNNTFSIYGVSTDGMLWTEGGLMHDSMISNNTFLDGDVGINLLGYNTLIRDNYMECTLHAIVLSDSDQMTIVNNTIKWGQIYIYASTNINIEGNNIDSGSKGIQVQGTDIQICFNIIIEGNNITNSVSHGIHLWTYTSDSRISNNTISSSGQYGLYIQSNANNHLIQGNNFSNSGSHGIYIETGAHTVKDNQLWDNLGYSIYL